MDLINQRLRDYKATSKDEELNAYKEVCQEIALAALARADFFDRASFHGGTCLRIVRGIDRFSEDLDFTLNKPDAHFRWSTYFHAMEGEFAAHGLKLTVEDRTRGSVVVKKAFLKDDSFGKILTLQYPRNRADEQTIRIKLEIDTNPPEGVVCSSHVLNYPYAFSIVAHDLSCLFAGKCMALLSREYVKGRDWYDLLWYLRRRAEVNYGYLRNGLLQNKQFADLPTAIDRDWLLAALSDKIASIDWTLAQADIRRFLRSDRQHTVREWSQQLFLQLIQTLSTGPQTTD